MARLLVKKIPQREPGPGLEIIFIVCNAFAKVIDSGLVALVRYHEERR